jgi:hypothetical protein
LADKVVHLELVLQASDFRGYQVDTAIKWLLPPVRAMAELNVVFLDHPIRTLPVKRFYPIWRAVDARRAEISKVGQRLTI